MAVRPLVVDTSFENQRIDLGPLNVNGMQVTTGPEIVPLLALGGTYWVDNTAAAGGDGTDELPFDSITDGIAAIAALTPPVGTLLIAGEPDYSIEGVIVVPNGITVGIFAWRAPAQEPVVFALSATGSPNIYLRGCEVEMTLGDAVVQADMTSIVAVSSTGSSSLVMRGGSAREASQICRLTGAWDDAACSLMHVGQLEAVLDCLSLRCDACAVEGTSLTAATLEFRTTSFSTAIALDATTISMDRQSERSAALAGARPTSLPVSLESTNPIYGNGDGGDVVQAASIVLSSSIEYNNLSLVAGGKIRCENSILRVKNLLSLVAADTLAIVDYVGGAGSNGVGNVGGVGWGGTPGATQGTSGTLQAAAGANGTGGAGAQPTNVPTLVNAFGGKGGGGGAGGAGASVGGAARAAAAITEARECPHWPIVFSGPSGPVVGGSVVSPPLPIMGGHVGQAGSSGGANAAAEPGGGGGGSGRGGGDVIIYARGIELGPATPAAVISAAGQPGGNGGNGNTDAGGGGGGAGGGGGLVLIAYDWAIGTPAAGDEVSAPGGTGGTGGTGPGSGFGGDGGGGGDGGQIVFWNLLTNTRTRVLGAAGAAGGGTGGSGGGVGGAGGACSADFP